ncbi:MAG: zinc ribbon domain-containing protein [Planctomycetaceae bacterium]|nr:zinc ribbon domain-containing protein [Planctomycetaceae bacterium]
MPLFEYRCSQCHAEFELLVRSNSVAECPHCGTKQLEKLVSSPAVRSGSTTSLPLAGGCPPPSAGPCGPGCCRLPS